MVDTKCCLCSGRAPVCMFVRACAGVHMRCAPVCMCSCAHVCVAARVCGVRRRACVLARMCVCVCAGVHVRVAARACVRMRSHHLIKPIHVKTADNTSDIFTKPLQRKAFQKHRAALLGLS